MTCPGLHSWSMTDLGLKTRESSSKGHLTTSSTNDDVNHYFLTTVVKAIK